MVLEVCVVHTPQRERLGTPSNTGSVLLPGNVFELRSIFLVSKKRFWIAYKCTK